MTNEFYNANELSKTFKRLFIKESINLSYSVSCESKYADKAPFKYRGVDKRLTLTFSINHLLNDKTAILTCVDRIAYGHKDAIESMDPYEICFHTTNGPNNGWLLVYIFVNKESFESLIKKYNLKLIEY
jgi:hypothetical protein